MKVCGSCKIERPLSEFNRKGAGRYQSKCRECQKLWYKAYYDNNPREKNRMRIRHEAMRAAGRELIRTAKDRPCMDCKRKYPYYVMDFDHREGEGKINNVGTMIGQNATLKQIQAELDKCDIVCSNCHRERTHQRRTAIG